MYRKKPVVIEARQFTGDCGVAILRWINAERPGTASILYSGELLIATLEGAHTASENDWIIKGVAGEFYPCKPEIFEATYETADAA
jgi:hypothetical protein